MGNHTQPTTCIMHGLMVYNADDLVSPHCLHQASPHYQQAPRCKTPPQLSVNISTIMYPTTAVPLPRASMNSKIRRIWLTILIPNLWTAMKKGMTLYSAIRARMVRCWTWSIWLSKMSYSASMSAVLLFKCKSLPMLIWSLEVCNSCRLCRFH